MDITEYTITEIVHHINQLYDIIETLEDRINNINPERPFASDIELVMKATKCDIYTAAKQLRLNNNMVEYAIDNIINYDKKRW